MIQHRIDGIALVELVGGVGHKHHREFQPFGAVDRHNGHAAGAALADGRCLHPAARLGGVHCAHQGRKTSRPGVRCPRGKCQQVIPAAGTVRHGADRRQVTRAGKQLFDQLPHRQGTGQLAVNLHILQKRCKARVAAAQHRRIQAAAAHSRAQLHQIIRRVRVQRAEQHRGKLHILCRVIQHTQQCGKGAHMRGVQQVSRHIGINRDIQRGQGSFIQRKIRTAAQQNTEIVILAGAGFAGFGVPHGVTIRHHLGNACSNGAGICRGIGFADHIQLAQAGVGFVFSAHHKALAIAVINAAEPPGEKRFKKVVDPPDYIRRTAEVGIQRNGGRFRVRYRGIGRVGLPRRLLAHKDGGVRLAETVNALLDIPHKKQVRSIRRGKGKVDGILQRVGILVFVHQHSRVPRADGAAQAGALVLRCQQQFQRHVLQVCIVQHFFCQFSFQQCAAVLLHCADQRSHKRGGAATVCLIVSCRAEQKVRSQGRYLFFGAVPQHIGRHCRYVGCDPTGHPPGSAPVICVIQCFRNGVPRAVIEPIQHQQHAVFVIHQYGCQGFIRRRVLRCIFLRRAQKAQYALDPRRGFPQNGLPPLGLFRWGITLPHFNKALQRLRRVWQRLGKVIQFLHRPACGIIRPAAVIQVRKGTEVRIGICLFQHGGKGFLLQAHQGSVIRNGKIRRNIQSRKVLLHKMQAERIHCADGCPLQPHLLAAQAHILWMLANLCCQALGNIRPQLGRCRIGKCHDQQRICIHRVVRVGDQPRHTFHQHPRFAGAGRSRNQQAAAAGLNGRGLRRGKLNFRFRHCCLLVRRFCILRYI